MNLGLFALIGWLVTSWVGIPIIAFILAGLHRNEKAALRSALTGLVDVAVAETETGRTEEMQAAIDRAWEVLRQ